MNEKGRSKAWDRVAHTAPYTFPFQRQGHPGNQRAGNTHAALPRRGPLFTGGVPGGFLELLTSPPCCLGKEKSRSLAKDTVSRTCWSVKCSPESPTRELWVAVRAQHGHRIWRLLKLVTWMAPSAGPELQWHAKCDSWQGPASHYSSWQGPRGPSRGEAAAVASHIQDILGEQLASTITTTLVLA